MGSTGLCSDNGVLGDCDDLNIERKPQVEEISRRKENCETIKYGTVNERLGVGSMWRSSTREMVVAQDS